MAKTPKVRKPPYTSVTDVDAFFERIENMGEPKPPKKVDSAWVKNYDFETAHPSAIPAMLRWLGVINDQAESTGEWNKLRVDATRKTTLEQLVKDAYKSVFDAIDVENASTRDLRGAFVSVYSIGDSARHIKCFLALCEQAGIETAEAAHERESKQNGDSNSKPKAKAKPSASAGGASKPQATRRRAHRNVSDQSGFSVTLNVEIPASWTEAQISDRLAAIARAVEAADQDDS